MIYNFKLVSPEADDFKRVIRIDADSTFLDLRDAICDAVGYDHEQMSSFFLCDRNWEKEREITLEDMGNDFGGEPLLMDECELADYVEDEGQRLLFVFDYMTDRSFFLQLGQIEAGKSLAKAVCSSSVGMPPPQFVDMDEFIDAAVTPAKTNESSEFYDDEFGSSDGYDDDELEGLNDDFEL